MPAYEEKCFPRGGKERPELKKSPKTSKRKSWLVAPTTVAVPEKHVESPKELVAKRKKKVLSPENPDAVLEQSEDAVRKSARNLTLRTLSEGVIIVGYVREVTTVELKVNLPELIVGYVPAANVSEEYCKYLNELLGGDAKELQELTDMFKPGQLVVTRVEEICTVKGKTKVALSLIPGRVNRSVTVHDIMEGLLLSASVQSNEEHVYVMNCGIHGVKAILKKNQALNYENMWNNGKPLGVGQVLRCFVTKCITSEGSANVELTVDPEKLSQYFDEESYVPQNSGIVGKCFQLSVQKVHPKGLMVKFARHQYGYVHSNHMNGDFREMKKNALLLGRVLYIEPLDDYVIFSALKSVCDPHPPPPPFQEFKKGSRFSEARVISKKGRNLLVEFGENFNYYGLVSVHQLDIAENIQDRAFLNLVKKEYPPGSCHECKVLEYDFMAEKYICTFKRSIIKQKYTSIDELYPGLVTRCTVHRCSDKRITLKLYDIRGFVEPIQFSDVPDSGILLTKGQKVKAKVLTVKNPICEFTLKPALVNSSNPILTKFSDGKCGVQYEGVIVLVNDKGVLVKFYADFTTFVSKQHVVGGKDRDLNKLYYVGQVVKCKVLKIIDEEQKLILSVQPLENQLNKSCLVYPLKIGKLYTVIVKKITQDGLIVQEEVEGVMGRLPASQLTDSPQISQLLSQSYKEGEKLQALCLNGGDQIMFSASPTFKKYLETSAGKKLIKKGFAGLMEGMVVPSVVAEISPDKLILSLPVFEKLYSVSVASNHVCNGITEDIESLGIQKDQTLMVQILDIFGSVIDGACNLELVCDRSKMVETGIMLLQDFMFSQKLIHNFWKSEGNPLGELQIGSQVEGTVVAVTTIGAVVNLNNGARAVVMPMHISKDLNLEVHVHVKGTVMYVDTVNQCVEITLWKHVQETFSSAETILDVGKHKKGIVYISRPDVLVCGVKHFRSSYIVYVPSRWHINDLRPTPFLPIGVGESLTIAECETGMLFGVPRKVELIVKRCRRNESDADSAEEDDSEEEKIQHSSKVKEKDNRKKEEEDRSLENCTDFISINSRVCVKNVQKLMDNGTATNVKHIKKGEQKPLIGFDESFNSSVSDNISQLGENVSKFQDGSSVIAELKKKKKIKAKSHENNLNEMEMTEDSTVSTNNEKLTDVKVKSKKQKRKAENDNSLVQNGFHVTSKLVEENLQHVDFIKNERLNNSLEMSVNHSQTEVLVPEIDEKDVFITKESCDQNIDYLTVEKKSKKRKENVANNRSLVVEESSDFSQKVEENLHELVINNENKTHKRKRKASFEKSENEIHLSRESFVSVDGKKDSSRNDIEKIDNNLQTSGGNESLHKEDVTKIKNKKQKRESVVNQSSLVEKSSDLACRVEDNLGECVINKNANESDIMKKKKKTKNSLLNHQNEDKNSLVSNINLTKETKNANEEINECHENKGYEKKKKKKESEKKCEDVKQPSFLNVCAGFFWNATPDQLPAANKVKNAEPGSSSEDENEVTINKKKKQRLSMVEKRELARQEEERLRKVEERLMDAERNPVSADDFDRLVMAAPNDSRNWIKYMAYHLEATEIGKARAVAERALKTISFREEQEKLNVWMALLNLENLYGTQESLEKTLEEAVQMNDSYKIHMQVLNMYSTTKKLEELNKMVQLVTKKYKSEVNTWVEAGLACIKCGEIEKSRQLMQRALTVLDKKYHVEVLTRYARMENEWGETERAETLMENVLTSYPKRIDVWSVYIDMLVKSKKFDIARQVLDRAVIQKLPVAKMKFLFKKYLSFEQTHGTPDRVEKIREMAKNFVENLKTDID
ncbi:hypothetical protein R5R35_004134 [Gryllus longicercus]|uniref:S1 motif domain-containing protein n=1 Tax=Gryllus longicercus TaxID=2509291 RepID=A0AAN9VAX9_9ORTH